MDLIEFMDLYELEPVMARLRLHELNYSFDDAGNHSITFWMRDRHKGLYAKELKRWQEFSTTLSPTWVGLLSLHSRAMVMDVDFDRFTDDDWVEMRSISKAMDWYHWRQLMKNHSIALAKVTETQKRKGVAWLPLTVLVTIRSVWQGIYQRLLALLP